MNEEPRHAYEYEELGFEKRYKINNPPTKGLRTWHIVVAGCIICFCLGVLELDYGIPSRVAVPVLIIGLLSILLYVFCYYWFYLITKRMKQLKKDSFLITGKIGFITMSVLNIICFCPYTLYIISFILEVEIEDSFGWFDIILILYILLLITTLVLSIINNNSREEDFSNSLHWKGIL